MKLFVGLGNPGAKYAQNRHNIGFMALDRIASDHGFAPWRSKFQGQLSEGRLGSTKVILLKPETFMNLSGQSVGEAMRFFKLDSTDIVVFHDEIDLAPAKVRLKSGGGHAGHNDGAGHLADDEGPKFLNAVALRVNPPRASTGTKHPTHPKAAPAQEPEPEPDTRNPLQKLADRFR